MRRVIFGKTAAGKTRYCKELYEKYKEANCSVVTNIPGLVNEALINAPDDNKVKIFDSYGLGKDDCCNRIIYTELMNAKKYIVSSGDVLILDDIDCFLRSYDLNCIINMLSDDGQMLSLWKDVIIAGYSIELINLIDNTEITPVTFIDREDGGFINFTDICGQRSDIDDKYYETVSEYKKEHPYTN